MTGSYIMILLLRAIVLTMITFFPFSTNAGTYLRTQTIDTAGGMKYLGTSSTSAELQVA